MNMIQQVIKPREVDELSDFCFHCRPFNVSFIRWLLVIWTRGRCKSTVQNRYFYHQIAAVGVAYKYNPSHIVASTIRITCAQWHHKYPEQICSQCVTMRPRFWSENQLVYCMAFLHNVSCFMVTICSSPETSHKNNHSPNSFSFISSSVHYGTLVL